MTYSKKEVLDNVKNTLPESEYDREIYYATVNKQWQGYVRSDRTRSHLDKNQEINNIIINDENKNKFSLLINRLIKK